MRNLIFNKIEKLFEPEMILEYFSFLSDKTPFEVEDNIKLIENLGYFQNTQPNWSIYFSRLAPFFELGILFKSNLLQTVFYNGNCHDCAEAQIKMKLPQSPIFDIYKTDAHIFLKKIKIHSFFETSKMQCHFVRLQPDLSFVLFSKKAEPWNRLLIESLQKSLINYSL